MDIYIVAGGLLDCAGTAGKPQPARSFWPEVFVLADRWPVGTSFPKGVTTSLQADPRSASASSALGNRAVPEGSPLPFDEGGKVY